MTAYCGSCHSPVRWVVVQASGRRMPLDTAPAADGNILLLEGDFVRVLKADELGSRRERPGGPGPLYKSHFATCPDGPAHRRPR